MVATATALPGTRGLSVICRLIEEEDMFDVVFVPVDVEPGVGILRGRHIIHGITILISIFIEIVYFLYLLFAFDWRNCLNFPPMTILRCRSSCDPEDSVDSKSQWRWSHLTIGMR